MNAKIVCVAVLVAATLQGCARYEGFKNAIPAVADGIVDRAYYVVCSLPYPTEQRFLARKQIGSTAHKTFCKRVEP